MKKYFEPLFDRKQLSNTDISIVEEFFKVLEEGSNVYYPSCGYDFSDLYYIHSANLPEIGFEPKVFIHSDMFCLDESTVISEMKSSDVDFQITFEVKNKVTENSEILFYKFKNTRTLDEKFLLILSGVSNEDILKLLTNSSCKIPLVYSICDGITSGMGYSDNSISTIFYPAFSKELGIKYIITEQSGKFDFNTPMHKSYIDSLLKFSDRESIFENFYTYEKIAECLSHVLQNVPERFINEPQIKIYTSHQKSRGLLIKTIPENFDFWNCFEAFLTDDVKQSSLIESGKNNDVIITEAMEANNDDNKNLIIKLLPYTTFEQLAKLPEIGKISKKLKTKFVTPLNLFLSTDNEAAEIKNVIETSSKVQNYLLSAYLLCNINQNQPIEDYFDELNIFFQGNYERALVSADFESYKSLSFEEYSKILLPEQLKTMLSQTKPNKLQVLCTDKYSFLEIKGMTENKLEVFDTLKEELLESIEIINLEKVNKNETVITAYDDELTLLQNICVFRDIIVNHVENYHARYCKKNNERELRNLQIFKLYYLDNGCLNHKGIAEKFGLSSEAVRLLLTDKKNTPYSIFNYLLSNQNDYLINFGGDLVGKIRENLNNLLYSRKVTFELEISEENYEIISKYVSFFGYNLVEFKTEEFPFYFLVESDKYSILKFRELYEDLLRKLKNEPCGLTFEALCRKLKLEINHEYVLNNLLSERPFILRYDDENELICNIQPNLLSSLMLKVERVLFTAGEPLHRDEIFEILNQIQLEYHDKEFDIEKSVIRSVGSVVNTSANVYSHTDFLPDYYEVQPRDFIKELMLSNSGKVTYDFVLEAMRKNHYATQESSIRAYLLEIALVSLDDKNLFIHKDYLDCHKEHRLRSPRNSLMGGDIIKFLERYTENLRSFRKSELEDAVHASFSHIEKRLRKQNFELAFNRIIDASIFIELNGSYVLNPQRSFADVIYRREPFYKIHIKSSVISDLKDNPEGMSLKDLKNKYITYLPEGVAFNNIYKLFDDDDIFEKFNDNKFLRLKLKESEAENISDDFSLEKLKKYLEEKVSKHFISKSHFDHCFEIFISFKENLTNGVNLLRLIYNILSGNSEKHQNFSYMGTFVNSYEPFLVSGGCYNKEGFAPGLMNLIHSNTEIRDMYFYVQNIEQPFNVNMQVDRKKLFFSSTIVDLHRYRNLYAHQIHDEEIQFENSVIVEKVENFVALFMYTSYLLKRAA